MVMLAAATSFMIFVTSERCFTDADRRNAITLCQTLRAAPGVPTLPEALAQRHSVPIDQIGWRAELTDQHYGFVRVTAEIPQAERYVFDVHLAAARLHPGNDAAKALMEELRPLHPDSSP
jgi:hypothetical protein